MNNKTAVILYHNHCIDGYTAAWACQKGLVETRGFDPECVTLHAGDYDNIDYIPELASNFSDLYIVDFSLPPEMLAQIAIKSEEDETTAWLFDHHKTAFESLTGEYHKGKQYVKYRGNCHIYLDDTESGASLVWTYFFGKEGMPALVEHVRDYDLWNHGPDTQAVNKFLRLTPKTIEDWSMLCDVFENKITRERAIMQGHTLQLAHNQLCERLADQGETPVVIDGVPGLACNAPIELASDVGTLLAKRSGTYGAVWHQQAAGRCIWSLRSDGADGVDVSILAKKFNGGGHRNAAGFVLTEPQIDGITMWSTESTDVGIGT